MPTITSSASTTGDVDLHVDDVGSGRPVVLIHGWPLSARSWEAQVPALVAAGHRVISYDRRGFGGSSQPWDGYDYDTFAGDLDAVLTGLDVHDAVLVGFSMGGGEVARYLGRYGTDRVSGAVFAAAVPPYLYKSDDNPDGGLDDATIAQFEQGVTGDRPAFLEGFVKDFMSAGDRVLASDAQLHYLRTIAEFASPKGTLDCIAAFGRTDFRDDLTRVTVPTLVVHGDSDAIVPFEVSGKRTHEAIAGSTLVVVEGGPHGINASHPDEFNRALLDFLASLDAPAASTTASSDAAPTATDAAPVAAATAATAAGSGRHEAHDDTADATATPESAATDTEPSADPVAQPSDDVAGPVAEDAAAPVAETPPADPDTAPATGDDEPAPSGGAVPGLTWRTAEENDPANAVVDPTGARARREGWAADPNLGDVPVDQQPHPGSLGS